MVDHVGNASNGNTIKKIATTTSICAGRLSGFPIYQISRSALKKVCGDSVEEVLKQLRRDSDLDYEKNKFRRTNHDDRLGNLPVAPGDGVEYREYHIESSGLPTPDGPGWFCCSMYHLLKIVAPTP